MMMFIVPLAGLILLACVLAVMAVLGLIRFYLMRNVADANIKACGAWLHFRSTLIGFAPSWWWTNRSRRGPVRVIGLSVFTPSAWYDCRAFLTITIGRQEYGWRRARIGGPFSWVRGIRSVASLLVIVGVVGMLAACTPQQQQQVAAAQQKVATVSTDACTRFRQAEVNPIVQAALPAGEALAGAALGAVTGGIATPAPALAVGVIKSFGDNYCKDGAPAGDTTTPEQQAAWLDTQVTAKLLAVAGVHP